MPSALNILLAIVIAVLLARVSMLTTQLEKRENVVPAPIVVPDPRKATDSLLVSASEYLLTKRYSDALRTYQSVLSREPGNQMASLGLRGTRETAVANYVYRAFQYREAGEYDSAVRMFDEALRFDPADVVARRGKEGAIRARRLLGE